MAQIRTSYEELRVPFAKMSFTPDVPSAALGPNEYNQGKNVETDVRGIRSVPGDLAIFDALPFKPVFITAGFRRNGEYWVVVALESGNWFASNGQKYQYSPLPAATEMWYEITPSTIIPTGYNQNANITVDWNGTILFVNDGINAPFVWLDELSTVTTPTQIMLAYSNQVPLAIQSITPATTTTKIITFTVPQANPPFSIGEEVVLTDIVPQIYNGVWTVTNCTATDVTIDCDVTQAYYGGGEVAPKYSWNYNPLWQTVTAGFQRVYNTPNVGSILVAGNLTALTTASVVEEYPTTIQWSQAFGLNQAPLTWTPTVTNVANQLEIPLRGPALDGFTCQGQFFISSYWDTVVLSPLNYTTTSTPILGVKISAKNRGLLSSNAWCDVDGIVYGVDSRDIWVFNGQQFQSIGNQRVKNWFHNQIDPQYYDRVYLVNNSNRQQIEIYYPDADAQNGVPNKMLSYRYDLDCWNAPRDTANATYACESPIWEYDSMTQEWTPQLSSRTVIYANVNYADEFDCRIVERNRGYEFIDAQSIDSEFRRDNIRITKSYTNKVMVHRILPEVVNVGAEPFTADDELEIIPSTGTVDITIEGANSVGSAPASKIAVTVPLDTDNPWAQINQNAYRVNSIKIENSSNTNCWAMTAVNWQFTAVEDDR